MPKFNNWTTPVALAPPPGAKFNNFTTPLSVAAPPPPPAGGGPAADKLAWYTANAKSLASHPELVKMSTENNQVLMQVQTPYGPLYVVPETWGAGGGGMAKLSPTAASAAGGAPVSNAFSASGAAGARQGGYAFDTDPRGLAALQPGAPGSDYTPGTGGGDLLKGAWEIAKIPALALAVGYLAPMAAGAGGAGAGAGAAGAGAGAAGTEAGITAADIALASSLGVTPTAGLAAVMPGALAASSGATGGILGAAGAAGTAGAAGGLGALSGSGGTAAAAAPAAVAGAAPAATSGVLGTGLTAGQIGTAASLASTAAGAAGIGGSGGGGDDPGYVMPGAAEVSGGATGGIGGTGSSGLGGLGSLLQQGGGALLNYITSHPTESVGILGLLASLGGGLTGAGGTPATGGAVPGGTASGGPLPIRPAMNRTQIPFTGDFKTYGQTAAPGGGGAHTFFQAAGGPIQGPLSSRYMRGPGGGQDDLIDAKVADGEYVLDASTVSDLGDGSNDAGAAKLDRLVQQIRQQKRGGAKGLPPRAKSPLEYIR